VTDTLLDVIDKLTIEHPYPARIEGRTRWVRRDPLIQQLREAVASSLTGGNGTPAAASRVPFDADAMEQYDKLEALILDNLHQVAPDHVPHLLPEQNLRTWYRFILPTLDEEKDRFWMKVWAIWESRIEAKLDAPVVLELIDTRTREPYECPDCGMGWFEVVLNSGPSGKGRRWYEKEKRVALTAMYRPDGRGGLERSAVECGCCGWRITGNNIRGFAWELENTPRAS
jgi:hypothetical protein